ncbi:MAG: class I SAM-dependent methyltransferase [Parcubacteria group bacterium]|jgi:SAM-dependent methyltransferase
MKGLPDSKIYEQELEYWPYKASWHKVLDYICQNTPENGSLLDLMCGPGYLLGKIAEKRGDIELKGMDVDERYVSYAKEKYPKIDFDLGDIFLWKPEKQFDAVVCTGSLHHIPYDQQEDAVKRMASMVKPEGFVLISDCYIDDYSNETKRKLAAAKLGHEYLKGTIENGAPDPVIEPCIEILWNDVLMKEFKTSTKKRLPIFEKYFQKVETLKTWPNFESEYGDYISICRGVR